MGKDIQLINFRGRSSLTCCQTNHISSPESFDDYKINIIDLSNPDIWKNRGMDPNSINIMSDLDIIASMLKSTTNYILIILPQNINYYYDRSERIRTTSSYTKNKELKNITSLIDKIIKKLINQTSNQELVMYNKTKTKVKSDSVKSDFIFNRLMEFSVVTTAENGKSITTCQFKNKYLTTLDLASDDYKHLLNYLVQLEWVKLKDEEPSWVRDEKFFDDDILISKQIELENQLFSIKEEIKKNKECLARNNYYKSILYKSGDNLVDVINIMLDEMIEYDYNNFEDINEEDFLIEKQDCVFIGEIKGINTNVKRANITQTATHRNFYLDIDGNENKTAIAIIIVNRLREKPVQERDKVTEDVIRLANFNDVLIITSEIFLKLYETYKFNKISRTQILDLLKSKKGILEESDFISN